MTKTEARKLIREALSLANYNTGAYIKQTLIYDVTGVPRDELADHLEPRVGLHQCDNGDFENLTDELKRGEFLRDATVWDIYVYKREPAEWAQRGELHDTITVYLFDEDPQVRVPLRGLHPLGGKVEYLPPAKYYI